MQSLLGHSLRCYYSQSHSLLRLPYPVPSPKASLWLLGAILPIGDRPTSLGAISILTVLIVCLAIRHVGFLFDNILKHPYPQLPLGLLLIAVLVSAASATDSPDSVGVVTRELQHALLFAGVLRLAST